MTKTLQTSKAPTVEQLNSIQAEWMALDSNAPQKEKQRVFRLMAQYPKLYIARVYYVSNATQGAKMVPNAQSIAYKFSTVADALAGIGDLRQQYAGLSDWKAEVVL